MSARISVEITDRIAWVTLDEPGEKVNLLSGPFLQELESTAKELAEERGLRGAVVLSAKEAGFIAGADIQAIAAVESAEEGANLSRQGQRIFNRWAALPFPVVAAIHGHCLGGGAEFALACHYRLASFDAVIGLPEVKLGILPGFGGTQRLPRLIPLQEALELILSGRTVKAAGALKIGLVDDIVDGAQLRQRAKDVLSDPGKGRGKVQNSWSGYLLNRTLVGRALLFRLAARKLARQSRGHYPAPVLALDTIRRGLALPLAAGLEREAQALGHLICTPVCRNLVHLFFLSQRAKKGSARSCQGQEIKEVAVLGAGVMGQGISRLLAGKGIPVRLKDLNQDAVAQGLAALQAHLSPEALALIRGITTAQELAPVDLVIEAVAERLGVKEAVLREVEGHMSPSALFATNTSGLSVSALQRSAVRGHQVAGLHFFNPADRMPLVEIVRGTQTSEQTVATLLTFARRLGKIPIEVVDRPGFLVNRILMAYLNEACLLATAGVDWRSIDARVEDFGLPMGPFRLLDEVGIDIAAEVGAHLARHFSYLTRSPLPERAVALGWVGKKGGRGFYRHKKQGGVMPNRALEKGLELHRGRPAAAGDLRRLLLLMVNEAGRCLEEGVVATAEDVDTGLVFGAGFPPFRGGLCRWADGEGVALLVQELDRLAESLGERFAPCAYLRERARFYEPGVEAAAAMFRAGKTLRPANP